MNSKQSIFLIGFMAAGKSSLGQELADYLDWNFYDLDRTMEASLNLSISEIFDRYDEAYFRLIEGQVCRQAKTGVISTGGGCPMYYNSLEWMKQHGLVVFIHTSFELILHRLETDSTSRPLAYEGNPTKIKQLYTERLITYRQAHLVFNSTNNLDKDVNDLVLMIDQYGRNWIS